MRVAIAGAGAVGRSIAGELLENGHEVLLIDKNPGSISVERVPQAEGLVEEAVSVGDLVRLMRFSQGDANLVELTLPPEAALVGTRVGDVEWPTDTSLVTIIRGHRVLTPSKDDALEAGDEMLFVAAQDREEQLEQLLSVTREATG